jgi:aspartate aminotransferase
LNMDIGIVHDMVKAFRARRDLVLDRLSAIDGVICPRPEGAFYLFPDIGAWLGSRTPQGEVIKDSQDLCLYILNQHDVAMVPGQAFGGPTGIRMSYAASEADLTTACDRLETAFSQLQRP